MRFNTVIASVAKQSRLLQYAGLLRRYAPRNDGLWLLPIALLTFQDAFAQRIPDQSLPPEESMDLPDVKESPYGNKYDKYFKLPDRQQPITRAFDASGEAPADEPTGPFSEFMEGYCDPGFRPQAAAPGMEACLDEQKKRSCEEYQHLPGDARRVIDDTISCLYSAGNYAEDESNVPVDPSQCAANDTQRLKLLKKYWKDASVAHALVFLPDAVIYAGNRCLQGGR